MRSELAALRQQVNMQANQGAMQPAGGYAQQPMVSGSLQNTGGFFKKDPGGMVSASNYSPWAMEQMQQMAQQGYSGLQDLLKQGFDFAPIAERARTDFAQTTIPSIAERFASLGTGGSQRSSAFPQLLSQAGGNLEKELAALQAQYAMQNKGMNAGILQNMLGQGMVSPWQNMYRPGSQSGISNLFNQGIQGLGQAAGTIGGAMLFA
jgi:hypothetical protein